MTKTKSTVVGLAAKLSHERKATPADNGRSATVFAASDGANEEWGALCSAHRRNIIRFLSKMLAHPYEWLLTCAKHVEQERWAGCDFVIANVRGVWLTFRGYPDEGVWVLKRIGACRPDCSPDDDGAVAVEIHIDPAPGEDAFAMYDGVFVNGDERKGMVEDLLDALAAPASFITHNYARGLGVRPDGVAPSALRVSLCLIRFEAAPAYPAGRAVESDSGYVYLN